MSEDAPHYGNPIFEVESTALGQWLRVWAGERREGIQLAWGATPADIASSLRGLADCIESVVAPNPSPLSPLEQAFEDAYRRDVIGAALLKLGHPSSR